MEDKEPGGRAEIRDVYWYQIIQREILVYVAVGELTKHESHRQVSLNGNGRSIPAQKWRKSKKDPEKAT